MLDRRVRLHIQSTHLELVWVRARVGTSCQVGIRGKGFGVRLKFWSRVKDEVCATDEVRIKSSVMGKVSGRVCDSTVYKIQVKLHLVFCITQSKNHCL